MNQGWLHQTLIKLGLKPIDIQTYTLLFDGGPQTEGQIMRALKTERRETHRSISDLRNKGFIRIAIQHADYFSAEPIERILARYADAKNREAQKLEEDKQIILRKWQSRLERERSRNRK